MKAIIQIGPRSIETQEWEVPTPGIDELLIKVHTTGLCGSSVHAYKYDGGYEWIPTLRTMGHEYSGMVTEVGANIETFEVDDKVVEEPIHDCGHYFQCRNGQPNACQNFSATGMHRDGTYTEYVIVTPEHVRAVPEGVPLRRAAITEPTSIATRAVLSQSVTAPDDDVFIEGPGPIGALVAAITDSPGANVVVSGLSQDAAYRLPLLEDLGIDTVSLEEEGGLDGRVESQTDDIGLDVVFDAAGHHSGVVSGNDVVHKGGQIVVVGAPNSASELSLTSTVRGEVDINTSYGPTWTNFKQALRLMERGEIAVEKILDASYSVDDPAAAFEAFLGSETCKPVFQLDG